MLNSGMILFTWKVNIESKTIDKLAGNDIFNIRKIGMSWIKMMKGNSKCPCPKMHTPKKTHLKTKNVYFSTSLMD